MTVGRCVRLGAVAAGIHRALVCDLDSTLWPFNDALRGVGDGASPEDDWLGWGELVRLSGSERAAAVAMERAQSYESMQRFGLFVGVRETFAALRRDGVRIVVATDRPPRLADDAARFLAEAGLECSVYALTPSERISYCLRQGIRVLVDDRPETLAAAHDAGLAAVALRYRYNEDVLSLLRLPHADAWPELASVISDVLEAEYRAANDDGGGSGAAA